MSIIEGSLLLVIAVVLVVALHSLFLLILCDMPAPAKMHTRRDRTESAIKQGALKSRSLRLRSTGGSERKIGHTLGNRRNETPPSSFESNASETNSSASNSNVRSRKRGLSSGYVSDAENAPLRKKLKKMVSSQKADEAKSANSVRLESKPANNLENTKSSRKSKRSNRGKTRKDSVNKNRSRPGSVTRNKRRRSSKEIVDPSVSLTVAPIVDGQAADVSGNENTGKGLRGRKASHLKEKLADKKEKDDDSNIAVTSMTRSQSEEGVNGRQDGLENPDTEWEVEEILDFWMKGEPQYLVKWKNWASDFNSWEPMRNLSNCNDKILQFREIRYREILMANQHYAKNKNQLREILNKLPLPPDPRLACRGLVTFFKKINPISELEILKEFPVLKDVSRWTEAKLRREANKVASRCKDKSFVSEVRKQVILAEAYYRHDYMRENLEAWEKELNNIAQGKPKITVINEVDFTMRPRRFKFINDYVAGQGITIPKNPVIYCRCTGEKCVASDASCCPASHQLTMTYNSNKRLIAHQGTPIFECNSMCSCGPECPNRVVQDGQASLSGMEFCIFRTINNRGWGVKTLKLIEKGTFVGLYVGEIILSKQAERRGKQYDDQGVTYLFDLDFNETDESECLYTVDAAKKGNVSHFMNHSCEPNLVVYNVWTECIDPNLPMLAMFSNRVIQVGEELTFDYVCKTPAMDESSAFFHGNKRPGLPCLCGSKKCRRIQF